MNFVVGREKMAKISKKKREEVKNKFGGLCAYSGTPLEDDWQVDHLKPIVRNWWDGTCNFEKDHVEDNMIPSQKLINHYKSSMSLEDFRDRMLTLHERLASLPKNPRTERSVKRIRYLQRIGEYFGVTPNTPFDGVFYFEKNCNKVWYCE